MLTSPSGEQAPPATSALLEIANVMVHLYKDAFGRGPSKTRAQFSGSDTLVVLLEDMMTIAERQLVASANMPESVNSDYSYSSLSKTKSAQRCSES